MLATLVGMVDAHVVHSKALYERLCMITVIGGHLVYSDHAAHMRSVFRFTAGMLEQWGGSRR